MDLRFTETLDKTTFDRLSEVAKRVVKEYLAVKKEENFLVVTDEIAHPAIGMAIVDAASALGVDVTLAHIRTRVSSGAEPPQVVAAAMVAADVCLCIAGRSIYHTEAKLQAQLSGTRGAFNAPPKLDTWTEGAMTADFSAIRKDAIRLADRLRGAHEVRVTSPAGSNMTVSVEGREPKGWWTGIVHAPGEISAFPGGEVSFPPVEGTSNGTIIIEHVMTDLGALSEPIKIIVQDGLATEIIGGEDARRLRELIDGVPGATNIGELGIGLNPAARITDEITETKKAYGTAHFALGDSAAGYGGLVECSLHLDGMLFDVSIWIDGEEVISKGKLII